MITMDKEATMAPTQEGDADQSGFDWAAVVAWFKEYYWIALIVGVIVFSIIVSIIMLCVCRTRTRLSRGLSQRFTKSDIVKSTHNCAEDSVCFESSIYRIDADPPPSKHLAAVEENNSYSYVENNRSKMEGYFGEPPGQSSQATFGYIDDIPEDEENDYDDAIILPQRLQAVQTLCVY